MEDFGPHHEIKMGKRQKEELAKTCSRFLDGEHIMRLRRTCAGSTACPRRPTPPSRAPPRPAARRAAAPRPRPADGRRAAPRWARDAGAPWTEWYLWRPTPDAAFDAAEVAVALEPTLRVDLAKLDMLPDTPVPGLSGLPVALDVVDAKRGVVDDDDWLRSGDVLVGLDGAPLENGVDACVQINRWFGTSRPNFEIL
ncbi:hypothetical protein SO694_00135056 [Aureococcus anophagefferens]|uniref:PDZ domain-containing protein n=1 Tax=Aureococcus anophagefferens TaxID=44056 RepID=A0ABR1GG51_AURAN